MLLTLSQRRTGYGVKWDFRTERKSSLVHVGKMESAEGAGHTNPQVNHVNCLAKGDDPLAK